MVKILINLLLYLLSGISRCILVILSVILSFSSRVLNYYEVINIGSNQGSHIWDYGEGLSSAMTTYLSVIEINLL